MLELTEEKLEEKKVTKGAARKIANSIQKLKEDMKTILADLDFILRSPIKIEDRVNEIGDRNN